MPGQAPKSHIVARCVRRAFLCGDDPVSGQKFDHRRTWIRDHLEALAASFGIEVISFAVMDNHLHVLLRLDSPRAESWSDDEVARRWLRLFPLRTVDGPALQVSETRVQEMAADARAIRTS
jgi:hypothetical protein